MSELWEDIAKWAAGIIGTVSIFFFEGVRRWNRDRFRGVHKRIDEQKKVADVHTSQLSEHQAAISRMDAHIENIKENTTATRQSIATLHDKLDKAISRGHS